MVILDSSETTTTILVVREENNDTNEEFAARQNEMEDAQNANGMSKMTRMKIMATNNSMEI